MQEIAAAVGILIGVLLGSMMRWPWSWLVAMPIAILLALSGAAQAADPAYCQLWAREYVRVQLTSFTPADRAEVIAKGKADLERSIARDYATCLNEDDPPTLPNVLASTDAFYLESLWTNLNAVAAAEKPAEAVPVPDSPLADPDWVSRCRARFRSFDADTGMVLMWKDPDRRKRGSVRVMCPEGR